MKVLSNMKIILKSTLMMTVEAFQLQRKNYYLLPKVRVNCLRFLVKPFGKTKTDILLPFVKTFYITSEGTNNYPYPNSITK